MAVNWPDFLPEVDGERRFRGTRVGLVEFLHFYNTLGYSAEMLALEFPSVGLALAYKFLAFYVENAAEVDAFVASEQSALDGMRVAAPDRVSLTDLRKRLAHSKPLSA